MNDTNSSVFDDAPLNEILLEVDGQDNELNVEISSVDNFIENIDCDKIASSDMLCIKAVDFNEQNISIENISTDEVLDPKTTDIEVLVNTVESSANRIVPKICWTSKGKICYKAINPSNKLQNNYLRGCLWSPDGTCLLTNSNDNVMRIYELPRGGYDKDLYNKDVIATEMSPVLNMREIDLIYDYCWYPFMDSNRPDTCLFASTSRKGAVRLWDAYYGTERAHIQPYDHLVEPVSAQSIAFSRDGLKLYCGFDRCMRVFDISRLNSESERRPRLGNKSELRGIISCIATSAANIGMYGCGSYSKDAAIFHEQTGEQILEFLRTDDRTGGITHIEFSPVDMNCVVTGGRIDNSLHVWDMRCLGSPLYSTAKRDVHTNQRIYFQFDPSGQYIFTGNHNGNVSVFSIYGQTTEADDYLLPKVAEWKAHGDVCNGISLHPSLPILATTSGQRRLLPPWQRSGMLKSRDAHGSEDDSDWSSDGDTAPESEENEVRLWSLNVEGAAENTCSQTY